MFTFNKTTGTYNVEFGNVPQKSKLQKMKQLIPDDQDPIFLVPTGSVVVFDNGTGKYTRKDKGKQRMETESDEEEGEAFDFDNTESEEEEETVDDVMADILDDVTGPAVVNTDDEEEEIYQMELKLEREMEQEEGEEKEKEVVVSRDAFIETQNKLMAEKGVILAIRQGNTRIPKTVLEKTPV